MRGVLDRVDVESWFLVQWPCGERPRVVREFDSRAEAEIALAVSLGDVAVRIDAGRRWLSLTLRSVLTMLEHAELREALAEWDTMRTMEEHERETTAGRANGDGRSG
jgi:hypothetical protein